MSVFTNPASRSSDGAKEYAEAVLELLEDREPRDVLMSTGESLAHMVAALTEEQLSTREQPDKWSVREVLRHVADSEIVWAFRLRMVLAQDRPQLMGFDQDAWATRLGYASSDPGQSLDDFRTLRRSNLSLLTSASDDDLQRVGCHAERGEETLDYMVRLYAGHDVLHLRQIERIRAAVART